MSGEDRDRSVDLDTVGITVARWIFGDRTGFALFLGTMLFFAVTWRIGIFSTDTFAVANTMASVADGSLSVDQVTYGPSSGITPGMHVVDGRRYGRNFGMVFAALPIVWLLEGLALFVDMRIALAGAWCLGLLGLSTVVGDAVGRRQQAVAFGSIAAIGLFAGNVAVATPIPARWWPVIGLQLVTMAAAGLTAVFLYRLVGRMYGNHIGLMAGLATGVASPVGFWATFPKRHAVTAFLAVLTLYCLFRSRQAPGRHSATGFRALAYGWVGLTAWVHSAEGLLLLIALVAVDLPTARSNRPLDLVVVAGALVLSIVPLVLTNYVIAGTPLEPPRLWQPFTDVGQLAGGETSGGSGSTVPSTETGSTAPSTETGPTGGSSNDGGGSGGTGSIGMVGYLVGRVASAATSRVELLFTYMETSLQPLGNAERLSNTFVRSGYISGLPRHNDRAINLSVLEAMPLLGLVTLAPAIAIRWARTQRAADPWQRVRRGIRTVRRDPTRTADLFAALIVALFVLLYMSRLPSHFMLTGRYIHPIYPLGVYALARLPPVRRAVREEGRRIAAGYALTVSLGVPLYITVLWTTEAVLGEAVQLYALTALGIATLVGGWAIIETAWPGRFPSLTDTGAPLLGVAAGLTTVYLLVSGLGFFAYTHEFALPMSRVVAEQLLPINPLRSLF